VSRVNYAPPDAVGDAENAGVEFTALTGYRKASQNLKSTQLRNTMQSSSTTTTSSSSYYYYYYFIIFFIYYYV